MQIVVSQAHLVLRCESGNYSEVLSTQLTKEAKRVSAKKIQRNSKKSKEKQRKPLLFTLT